MCQVHNDGERNEGDSAYIVVDALTAADDAHLDQLRGYAIADAYARFARAQGRQVLLALSFDTFGLPAESAALRHGVPVQAWVRDHCERARKQCAALEYSFDWERTGVSSDPECYRWTQSLFLALLERDVIYRRERQWLIRVGAYLEENERGLEALAGWDAAAIELQRAAIGRVDGVELRASTFDGASLSVFTPHSHAIAESAFVAISPHHPEIERWTTDPRVSAQLAAMRTFVERAGDAGAGEAPLAPTDALATVPGVAGMLPIVISPLVDERYGPTAALGIPACDPADEAIAKRLPAPAGTAWKASAASAEPRPAVRYRVRDVPISRARAWGAPVPLVTCPACGVVPVPVDELPIPLPDRLRITAESENPLADDSEFYECACPRCNGAARRETDTIDSRLDRMWMWMQPCLSPERRGRGPALEELGDCDRLPADQLVASAGASAGTFERRLLAEILQSADLLAPLPNGEPFTKALMHRGVRVEEAVLGKGPGSLDDLIALQGSDSVRLAMLYSASPGRSIGWNGDTPRYCKEFLQDLHSYAEPRLGASARSAEQGSAEATSSDVAADPREREQAKIDTSDRLRRRLARWCAAARESITLQLERLEMQRATHNAMRLLARIEDFEARALSQRGEVDPLDREAIVAALLILIRLLAPLAPSTTQDLWLRAGNTTGPVSEASWPGGPALQPSEWSAV
jgi:leucyl-tRNA synthetase